MPNPLFLLVIMFLVMYFLLIRPQARERKAHETMLASLKKGDKVVTIGGIFGTIQAVHQHELVVKVDEANTRLRMLRTAIHQRVSGDAATPAAATPAQSAEDSAES